MKLILARYILRSHDLILSVMLSILLCPQWPSSILINHYNVLIPTFYIRFNIFFLHFYTIPNLHCVHNISPILLSSSNVYSSLSIPCFIALPCSSVILFRLFFFSHSLYSPTPPSLPNSIVSCLFPSLLSPLFPLPYCK